jgi:hypothetical protein
MSGDELKVPSQRADEINDRDDGIRGREGDEYVPGDLPDDEERRRAPGVDDEYAAAVPGAVTPQTPGVCSPCQARPRIRE